MTSLQELKMANWTHDFYIAGIAFLQKVLPALLGGK
jgi:hypothetical protein